MHTTAAQWGWAHAGSEQQRTISCSARQEVQMWARVDAQAVSAHGLRVPAPVSPVVYSGLLSYVMKGFDDYRSTILRKPS